MEDSTANLRRLLEKIAQENEFSDYDMNIKPISTGGSNYTSQLYLATISNDINELNLFAKVIIMGEKMRSQVPDNIHEVEPFVYTELLKTYRQLEEKHKVPKEYRLDFPKFYGQNPIRGQEVLVLEDLSAQDYSVNDRFQSIDWPYALGAIKEMAKLHALSFAFKHEQPDEFEKAQKSLVNSFVKNDHLQSAVMGVLEMVLSLVEENNRQKLHDFIAKADYLDFIEYLKPLRHTVLIHGDFRVSNLMHKVDDKGMYHFKILDYQTMKCGAPVADLLYFIITGTDENFRAKHYQSLLDHYYSQLSLAMERLGLKSNQIYSQDDFNTEIKMKLPYCIVMAAFVLPIVMVEEEDSPIIDENRDLTSFEKTKIGKRCLDRINGLLNDYVRWKIL